MMSVPIKTLTNLKKSPTVPDAVSQLFILYSSHMPLFIGIAIIVVLILWCVGVYNGLIRDRNRTTEAWSDIDIQLKRRHDLIPNLIESVKGSMQHERTLLENITRARAAAIGAQGAHDSSGLARAEQELGGLISNLRVAVEAYPDLKASQNVRQLMDELSDTENKIQAARRFYNGQVRDFNTHTQTFPNTIFVQIFHFTPFSFFELSDPRERENVQVKF